MSVGEMEMSINSISNIVTNGLIFSYDMNSRRSYKGPPLQNKLSGLSATTGSGTGYVLTSSTETVNIPGVGDTPVTNCFLQNTGSSWCCVNFMSFGNTGNIISGGTLYTYLLLYRVDSGYTGANFMYRYEYNSSGTYQTEAGVFDNSRRVHLGNGWYYAWGTFTTQTATTNMTCYSFSYNYSNYSDKYSWAKVAIVQGDYSGMHPSLWPALGTTVSNTQSLLDLTNNNTLTTNNLVYANDGSFSFNGSNSVITSPNNTNFDTQSPTVEVWIKTNATTQNGFWFEKGSVNTEYSLFQETTNIVWRQGSSSQYVTTASYINTSSWAHIVGTYIPGSRNLYINGVLVASDTASTAVGVNSTGISIGSYNTGGYFYNGYIGVVRVYNRVLTAAEIQQNFNAMRGRYGL